MGEVARCRWAGSDQPRVITGRHQDECGDEACRGCQPCIEAHCRVCGTEHASGACPGCVGAVREDLGEIRRMCDDLPAEVEVRGVEGEAMALLGPAADPEAWGHREASACAGRVDAGYLETATDEAHPLWVTATWAMVYRDAFDHDEPSGRVVLGDEVGYLERNLTYAANYEHVPFEDFAKDVARCVGHLERVLHDGEQVDRTRVTCANDNCRRRPMLERKHGIGEQQDRWVCPSCRWVYEPGEYRAAMARQLVHKGAEKYVPLRDAVSTLVVQGRSDRTVRKWLAPPKQDEVDVCQNDECRLEWERDEHHRCPRCGSDLAPIVRLTGDPEGVVGGFCEIGSHRVWVWWPDLWRLHMTTKTRARGAAA